MSKTYKITITRFDSSVDTAPYDVEYEVPGDEEFEPMTALKALHWINKHIEPIGYDFNCRRGTCGRCSIMVDGHPVLACTKILEDEHKFTPLNGFPVVRDLIVDKQKAYTKFVNSSHAVKTLKADGVLQPIDAEFWRQTIFPLNSCRECMCCYASCMALQINKDWRSFGGPGAMQQIYLRSVDGQDQSSRIEQAVFSGLFECVQCGNCTTYCPAGIPCAENIAEMMTKAEEAGLKPEENKEADWWPVG